MKLFLLTSFGFPGYGGDGEYREGLDGEPRQVCPIARSEPLTPIEGARLGRHPHIGGGRISALQLQVERCPPFCSGSFQTRVPLSVFF